MTVVSGSWPPSGAIWFPPLRGRRGTTCIGKGSGVRPGVPLASRWCHLVSAALAWQAWRNVHCQGVGCTPWRPSGVPLVPFGLRRWCPLSFRRFCVAGVAQRALVMCIAKGSDGVPLASLWCGRRGTTCIGKGSDVCPGVPLASHWCHLVSALLRGRRGTTCIAKGSYVRPGVRLASLWCHLVSAALIHSAAYTTLIHPIHTPHAHTHTYIADTHRHMYHCCSR